MSMLSPTILILATPALLVVGVVWYIQAISHWRARTRGRPLPPGPKALPLVGNLFDMPKATPWIGYRNLSAKYGDILFFRTLGQSMIILGNPRLAFEFLEKRSSNYSARPLSPMFDLIGWEWNFGFMTYGHIWRRYRRLFWQHFHPGVVSKYHGVQRDESRQFLKKLLTYPERLEEHIRHTFAASVLKTVYGIDVAKEGDRIIEVIDTSMEGVSVALTPGAFLVEYLPFLRHIPEWLPGAGFQKRLRRWRDASHEMVEMPFAQAKAAMKDGHPTSSIVGTMLGGMAHLEDSAVAEEEYVSKNVAAISYAGGADTTISTFQTFFLAMSLHPEAVAKAQAELEAVVGPTRLPDHADRSDLPYVNAIIKECLRWQNAVPLCIPHAAVEDDEFDGYFIPAGTVVFPNAWAILHDPEAYPEPERFLPERFLKDGQLNPDVRDPATVAFGFGRRICPGRHFAEASLFINIARVLHVFIIGPPLDERGEVIRVEPKMKDGILSYPEDWRCTIKPRSAHAETLILGGEHPETH
ncbi:cytochrome P450 [Ganoderma sinense ZZ0214-1]|uniref:Cytochrome P450 n=1 Tax=Ganoderma sinense ZZ0214-1 TaxID=1077348 RepID=A0A2G8RMP2_9APHY|nr:cytochrome P450 [Ganoderma sinense ZZ0214-1]